MRKYEILLNELALQLKRLEEHRDTAIKYGDKTLYKDICNQIYGYSLCVRKIKKQLGMIK